MELNKLLILSLVFLPVSLTAENASDYAHRGAQKYIFGDEAGAKSEVANGLAKFPNDRELQEMVRLFRENKNNSQAKSQNQQQKGGKQDQKQQPQQNQNQQNDNQQSQPNEDSKGKDQQQNKRDQSEAKNDR